MKKYVVVGIIFLFIVTSLTPMVIGNTINRKVEDEYSENIFYANYDEYENIEFENYREISKGKIIENSKSYEIPISKRPKQILPLDGPMDSPWPMFCHDMQRIGRSPYAPVGNVAIEKWKFWMDGMTISSPAIDENGTIYTGSSSDQFLFALYSNGTEKWRFNAGAYVLSSPAISADGTIYVGANNGKLFAINSNGTQKWIYHVGSGWVFSSPVIDGDGIIYAASTGGSNIVAIYPNGTTKWEYITDDWIYCSPSVDHEGNIYIGSNDGYLYALYPNGTLKWKYETNGEIGSTPSIDESGIIYFGSADGYLYALYPNGTMKWRHQVGLGTESNPSIAPDGTIYVGGGYLYAVNPNGTRRWTFDFGSNRHSHQSSPAISADGIIYIAIENGERDGSEIVAVNPDGNVRWRSYLSNSDSDSSPAISSNGIVYICSTSSYSGSNFGHLHAFGPPDPNAPEAPSIFGELDGQAGTSYEYTFSALDPNDDDVYYYIEWGDRSITDWFGPYSSGREVAFSHIWNNEGNYTIKIRAKDTDDLVGLWGYLEVTMPVNQQTSYPLLQRLLERFPNAFPILRHLLEVQC